MAKEKGLKIKVEGITLREVINGTRRRFVDGDVFVHPDEARARALCKSMPKHIKVTNDPTTIEAKLLAKKKEAEEANAGEAAEVADRDRQIAELQADAEKGAKDKLSAFRKAEAVIKKMSRGELELIGKTLGMTEEQVKAPKNAEELAAEVVQAKAVEMGVEE